MVLEFSGEIVFWRGPAPWYFVPVPEEQSLDLEEMSSMLSYGWGCIPVTAVLGEDGVVHLAVSEGRSVPRAAQGGGAEVRTARAR